MDRRYDGATLRTAGIERSLFPDMAAPAACRAGNDRLVTGARKSTVEDSYRHRVVPVNLRQLGAFAMKRAVFVST